MLSGYIPPPGPAHATGVDRRLPWWVAAVHRKSAGPVLPPLVCFSPVCPLSIDTAPPLHPSSPSAGPRQSPVATASDHAVDPAAESRSWPARSWLHDEH